MVWAYYGHEGDTDRLLDLRDDVVGSIGDGVDEDEFHRAVTRYSSEHWSSVANAQMRAVLAGSLEQQLDRAELFGELPARAAAPDPQLVAKVARHWFSRQQSGRHDPARV